MSDKEKEIDWQTIELDYRAGIKTLRQIAGEHDISEGAIRKRAKRDDWTRDLSGKIKAKSDELVRKQEVRNEVRKQNSVTEKQVIQANAQAITDIRLSQRRDIQRSRRIVMGLFDELEHLVGVENVELLEQLGELMYEPDEKGRDRLNEIYQKIISLPGRVKAGKDLSEALKTLIALERQAFGLDDKENHTIDPLEKLLNSIAQANNHAFAVVSDDPEY